MYEKLSQTVLFKSMTADEIELLLEKVNYRTGAVKSGDIVALAGEAQKDIRILLQGSVRAEMLDYSGKAITIELLQAPTLLAPAFLFGQHAKLPVDIIARESVEILSISKPNLLKMMQLNAVVLTNFLDDVSQRTQFLAKKINFLSFKTIREKYLHFILSHYKSVGDKCFSIGQTQTQLSELFGVSRPALAKVIAELNDEKIIKTKGKSVEILDVSVL